MKITFHALPILLLAAAAGGTQGFPGRKADGTILLPNGWRLAPHGKQVPLPSDLPVRSAWNPAGRYLAVQHCGYNRHIVSIVDSRTDRVVSTVPLGKSWSGMAWSPGGDRLYVSGGVTDRILVFSFDKAAGKASGKGTWSLGKPEILDLPAGMCADRKGRLFVVLQRSHGLVRFSPEGKIELSRRLPKGTFPFECILSPDGKILFVSLWGGARVLALDAETGKILFSVRAGLHPTEMVISPDGKRLFVSNANENTVTEIDVEGKKPLETLSSALYPFAPPGSTPDSLALSKRGKILLVANADNNDCAVLDVSEAGRARGLGFIPLGLYTSSIRFSPDGKKVYAANGKGSAGSRPNVRKVKKGRKIRTIREYIGAMFQGSLSVFPFPSPSELGRLSERVYRCAPLRAAARAKGLRARPKDSPIPARVGDPSPIRYCVYIIKENRTYDQFFGDVSEGNGDPSLCIFPEKVTPNHHALAREFVLLDNFYVESEVSADGHEWSMGAYATDFVERTWPLTYSGKGGVQVRGGRPLNLGYPAEGGRKIAFPAEGYIWDRAAQAGISYRSYGEFVNLPPGPGRPATTWVETLKEHFDPWYRTFDLRYPDQKRADRFLEELKAFEKKRDFPRLTIIRLPNDHTAGTQPGWPTPRACVADNDLALGRIVEGLSRTSFWRKTAVFVVEDDAQNGPDHVDAHRTVALVAGPYVKRGAVVSALYSTSSMLRTMELILGLRPMSQFDAAALPMWACFTGKPDFRPYECKPAQWPLDEKNEKTAWGADLSERFDFTKEDEADDLLLNEVVWRSVKGPDSPMPPPRRAAFVKPR